MIDGEWNWERDSQAEGTAHRKGRKLDTHSGDDGNSIADSTGYKRGQNLRAMESLVSSPRSLGSQGRVYAEGDTIRFALGVSLWLQGRWTGLEGVRLESSTKLSEEAAAGVRGGDEGGLAGGLACQNRRVESWLGALPPIRAQHPPCTTYVALASAVPSARNALPHFATGDIP